MGTFLGDLRYALRLWRQTPTLTLVALLTLGIGIGANTAIFSIVKAVLLDQLQYPDPDLLMVLWERDPKGASKQVSNPTYLDWRSSATTFESMAAFKTMQYAYKGREDPVDVPGVRATPDLFDVLRVQPVLGRVFTREHAVVGRDKVVILSDGFWRRRLGADPQVIGQALLLDAQPYEIIGVMPRGFGFPPGQTVDVWTPLAVNVSDAHDTSRGSRGLNVVGRLRAGTGFDQAEQELTTIAAGLANQYPDTNQGWSVRLVPAREQLVQTVRPALVVVLAGVVFLLLIVCANVANLMLARLATRRREMAVRASLGAERSQLMRQVLVESLALALVGALLGLGLALASVRALRLLPPGSLPRIEDVGLDAGVLTFTLIASLAASIVFGVLPAVVASRADLRRDLGTSTGNTPSEATRRLLSGLVVAEVAIALVLLVGAGLLARSFMHLLRVQPGFATDHVTAAQIYLPTTKYREPHAQERFFTDLLTQLRTSPGVSLAGATSALPMHPVGIDFALPFTIEGRLPPPDEAEPHADIRIVTPGYLEALRIPLIKGRLIEERDLQEAPHVMVINQTLARRYFGDSDPLDVFITNPHGRAQVVGVVGDIHHYGLDATPRPEVFLPFAQNRLFAMNVVVRGTLDDRTQAALLRSAVASIDPAQPIRDLTTLERVLERSVFLPRFSLALVGAFALAALLLAAVGIYGVLSYTVSQRTRDIGVRIALGAEPRQARRLVLAQSAALVATGQAIGVLAALPVTRLMRGLLFAVEPLDPWVFAGVVVLLALVAPLSALVPAIRATRVDPIVALRAE